MPITDRYARLRASLAVERMQGKLIACIGAGGSASLLQGLARCGADRFLLLDFDRVEEHNLARQ